MNAELNNHQLVLLMRHAKSSWKQKNLPDHDRPLSKRGRRDSPRMGEFLRSQGLAPVRIVTSSATRAVQTAENVAAQCGGPPIDVEPRLYHADRETWRQVLAELPRVNRLLIIGHNPGLEEALGEITDGSVRMPTAAIACLKLRRDALFLTLDSLELIEVWRPKEL